MCQVKRTFDEMEAHVIDEDAMLEDEEDEWDPENDFTLRAKWMLDGAKTIEECVDKCKGFIEWLWDMKKEGWELIDAVSDDYGFMKKSKAATTNS